TRDFRRQVYATAERQTPLAAVLSCIDSRVPAELVFDLGIGDIFSVRVAGNVSGSKSLGSIEYGVGVAGVKLVLVLGHTRCGAVASSVQLLGNDRNVEMETGCQHLHTIVDEIAPCIGGAELSNLKTFNDMERESFVDEIAKRNVLRTVQEIVHRSAAVRQAIDDGKLLVVGAMYDVRSGSIDFLMEHAQPTPRVAS
ncbi:MAG: sulfate transporter, partial [Fuerstiella sp.]|nr:sulfate transporter [Fuerstiella sp.]